MPGVGSRRLLQTSKCVGTQAQRQTLADEAPTPTETTASDTKTSCTWGTCAQLSLLAAALPLLRTLWAHSVLLLLLLLPLLALLTRVLLLLLLLLL
jgi:hypothetical protein